jgi:hypothetical protein
LATTHSPALIYDSVPKPERDPASFFMDRRFMWGSVPLKAGLVFPQYVDALVLFPSEEEKENNAGRRMPPC